MARVRDPNRDKAHDIYIANPGIELIEIASQLNVPVATVRSWKSRDDWECNATQRKKRNVAKKKTTMKPIANEVKQVMNNPELTDKQRLFCLNYIKCFNATKAYQKAYEGSYAVANTEGPKLLVNPRVKEEIYKLKQGRLNQAFLEPSDIFQRYMDIAFADMNDYVTYGVREVVFSKDDGLEAIVDMSYVDVNESWMVDGTLISEISKGKDGIKLKLADKMKALDWIADHMDMATTEQRARIDHMKSKDLLDHERFKHVVDIDNEKYW